MTTDSVKAYNPQQTTSGSAKNIAANWSHHPIEFHMEIV